MSANCSSPPEGLDEVLDAVPSRLTSTDVLDRLERRYPLGRWVFLREVRVATGFGDTGIKDVDDPLFWKGEQRLDAWAIACSKGWERLAFEVKVSRADLRNELADPTKRAAAMRLSHRFYFVIAEGVRFDDLDIPEDCGILVARDRGIRCVREAPRRETPDPPPSFMAAALRRAQGIVLTPRGWLPAGTDWRPA